MITVSEAKQIISQNVEVNNTIKIPLNEALNCLLAESVYAPICVPFFDQSAMDGYAFKFNEKNELLNIVDEVAAGDTRNINVNKGEAVRIFTGAKVPDSCDAVVMQELTEIVDSKLKVNDGGLKLGGNIRIKGHQIQQGELALEKGAKITPATIGFLASLGIKEVEVYSSPKVVVLTTGSELVKPGTELIEGQVYESNTFMLRAALNDIRIEPEVVLLKDDLETTQKAIEQALQNFDIILLSGGISVGDYDFVKPSLEYNKVEQLFYKVKQKPGKPLFFGKKENKLIFALPGNPAAALSCFYSYVLPAINIQKGETNPFLNQLHLPLSQPYKKKTGRAVFLKSFTDGKTVQLLEGQGSDVLLSFANSNCLVFLSEEIEHVQEGELVEVHLLP